MKKVLMGLLALLLALTMSVTAFADTTPSDGFAESKGTYGSDDQMLPGHSYRFALYKGGSKVTIDTKDFKLEKEVNKGEKYIDSIGVTSGCIYLKTIDTYAVNMDRPAEIDVDITLTARRNIEKNGSVIIAKGEEFYYNICYDFGLNICYVETEKDAEDASTYAEDNQTAFASDGDRGWVNFDCGDIDVLMMMPRNGTVTFGSDDSAIEAVEKLYKPTGGSIEFVSFNAKPKISGTATLSVNNKYQYVYSYDGSTLTQLKTTESGRYRTWTVTDGTLGTYVLTTKAMPGGTAAQETSAAPSSSSAAPSSAAPVQSSSAAPAPSSSAAPAPSSSEPEESSAEEIEEPIEAPESSAVIEESQEPEEEPADAEVEEEPEKNSSSSFPTILVVILAVAIVAAVLIALLISKLGGSRR